MADLELLKDSLITLYMIDLGLTNWKKKRKDFYNWTTECKKDNIPKEGENISFSLVILY